MLSKFKPETVLAMLFFAGIIFISYKMWLLALIVLSLVFFIYMRNGNTRFFSSILLAFLISFTLFQLVNIFIDQFEISKEIRILLNRSLLILIIAGLVISQRLNKTDIFIYSQKPTWGEKISLPFHTVNVLHFWLTGLLATVIVFIPFIFRQDSEEVKSLLLFGLFFSLINAVFEEVIWRGILLSSIQKYVSIHFALIIPSVGFGLLHLAIGMPMIVSLLFSLAGLYYVLLVLKSKSIYPAIIHHFFINMGMVLSGWIL
jgi:uncharacterized protein